MKKPLRSITILYFVIIVKVKCSNLVDFAVFVAKIEYDPTLITSVLWEHSDPVDITEILMRYPGCVTTVRVNNNMTPTISQLFNKIRVKQTIFVASTPEKFEYMAKTVKKEVVQAIKAILLLTQPVMDSSEVSKATKAAWENDIGDIIVLTTDAIEDQNDKLEITSYTLSSYETSDNYTVVDNVDDKIEVWTYLPYGNSECGNFKAVPLDITGEDYFSNKFTNFNGCSIRVSLLHFIPYLLIEEENDTVVSVTGIDGNTLHLILDKLNASLDIVSSKDHGGIGTYINGTATGSFGDLVNGIADIFAPAILITDLRYAKSQFSYVYQTLDVYWCGPNQREIHAWAKVFLPFFTNITPFIILTFVVFILVTKIIRRYDLSRPARRRGVFFMTFVMFLGQEVNFETNSWLINSLFVLWIWFCMIVRIGYQGDLVDGLQKVLLEPPLGSFEEALTKVQGYGGVEVFRQYYRNTSVAERFINLKLAEIPIYIEEVAKGQRFLIATDILLVKWFRQTLQVLEKPLTRAAVCLYMRAGWPAAQEVQRVTYTIAETGLIEKIMDDFNYYWLLHNDESADVRESQALNMAILGACFYGLLVMHLLCFVVFCSEIICHKYKLISKFKRKFKVK